MKQDSKKYLPARAVMDRYGGRSQMWLHRKLKNDPDFPKPLYIGRLRFWDEALLEAYECSLIARAA